MHHPKTDRFKNILEWIIFEITGHAKIYIWLTSFSLYCTYLTELFTYLTRKTLKQNKSFDANDLRWKSKLKQTKLIERHNALIKSPGEEDKTSFL
jgi:hypothetical protein